MKEICFLNSVMIRMTNFDKVNGVYTYHPIISVPHVTRRLFTIKKRYQARVSRNNPTLFECDRHMVIERLGK